MQLSALTFERQFSRFKKKVHDNSGGRPFSSFRDGLPAEWEEYEEDVRNEALGRLRIQKWKRTDVGRGRILENVIRAIEINDPSRVLRNNLVDWQNRFGHKALSHRALLEAESEASQRRLFEQWFFDFFRGSTPDADAFESFRELAGNRYDLIAYLFFLKDWDRFMPIAPTVFDEAFQLLEFDLVTARHCSWENYSSYNSALLAVQRSLREVAGVNDARLIDAQSFCWMLVQLRLDPPPPATIIPLPQVVGGGLPIAPRPKEPVTESEFETVTDEDFVNRDAQLRRLGRLAQEIALQSEQRRLREAGHTDAKGVVKAVWDEPGRGFDILSLEIDGTPRYIEVKAARKSGECLSFVLTHHEWKQSRLIPNYRFYLVLRTESRRPVVLDVDARSISMASLAPINYLTSFRISEGVK